MYRLDTSSTKVTNTIIECQHNFTYVPSSSMSSLCTVLSSLEPYSYISCLWNIVENCNTVPYYVKCIETQSIMHSKDCNLFHYDSCLVWPGHNTLLKSKGYSLRCHGFVVHTFLLRMNNNVVDFRVMRSLMPSRMKFTKREPHSWDPRQRTTWSRVVTSDFNSV